MRVRNISWTFSDQLSFRDERTGGVCIHQNLVGVVFEDVPIGALLQFFLNGRPFDNLTGLFDPIERDYTTPKAPSPTITALSVA